MLKVALPKGRLGNAVYKMFADIGYDCAEILEDSRRLIFENEENGITFFLVKPADVAIYVELGAADIGVVGKDTLLETEPDVFELLDLQMGKCSLAVAAPVGYREDFSSTLWVATKYPHIATNYYRELSRKMRIIKLNGSIELGPLVNLSDVIVDIVETGNTLRENDLEVIAHIADSSARLISNKVSYQFHQAEIQGIVEKLGEVIGK